jgi:DNA helicase-2/ATP-dependent DNA helicase PcrA
VYALGYEQRFGQRADLLEVCNLDAGGSMREIVDDLMLQETAGEVGRAGQQVRDNRFERHIQWCSACDRCDFVGVCRDRARVVVVA